MGNKLETKNAAGQTVPLDSLVRQKDPICGNCGNPLSKHYNEREIYCNDYTNGDIFTDEPRECVVMTMIEEEFPEIIERVVAKWKRKNGHA